MGYGMVLSFVRGFTDPFETNKLWNVPNQKGNHDLRQNQASRVLKMQINTDTMPYTEYKLRYEPLTPGAVLFLYWTAYTLFVAHITTDSSPTSGRFHPRRINWMKSTKDKNSHTFHRLGCHLFHMSHWIVKRPLKSFPSRQMEKVLTLTIYVGWNVTCSSQQ